TECPASPRAAALWPRFRSARSASSPLEFQATPCHGEFVAVARVLGVESRRAPSGDRIGRSWRKQLASFRLYRLRTVPHTTQVRSARRVFVIAAGSGKPVNTTTPP